MKIALFGNGKTGGAFREAASRSHQVTVFSRSSPATREILSAFDVAVVFVPAAGLGDLLPLLAESGIPVVSGTTGFDYSSLPQVNAPWIFASNFSLGMNIAFLLTKALANITNLAPAEFRVHEEHHTGKKDSPSGTALFLKSLLPAETEVTAERIGDAKGLHQIEARLGGEVLRIEHEALDRSVFAAGALFALENLLPSITGGVHKFENLMEQKLRKELFHV